jgi:multisubunit Na+/H+ antiporter MnhE subunit
MLGFALRAAGLLSVYLLVLTSVAPGDVLVGAVLSVGIVALTRPRDRRSLGDWIRWTRALVGMLFATATEMVIGTVRTIRFCLGWPGAPGFVEIPRGERSRRAVALWGVLTGEAPDEYPVDVDEAREVLIVHVLDARDPAAVRARHAHARARWQREVIR